MAGNSALSPVQAEVFALLNANGTLSGKVYDHVPEAATFPFVALAELRERLDDTLGNKGRVVTVTIDVYSQAEGYKELEDLAEIVIQILNTDSLADPTAPWKMISSVYSSGVLERELDGLTRHAELIFDVSVEA